MLNSTLHYTSVSHAGSLMATINKMRVNSDLCDVTVVVGGYRIMAHKIILSASAPFFYQMLQLNSKPYKDSLPEIQLTNIDEIAALKIIEFCYTSAISLDDETVWPLLAASIKFQLPEICSFCREFLVAGLDISNCVLSLRLAAKVNCPQLEESCVRFLLENIDQACLTDGLVSLSAHELYSLLSVLALHDVGPATMAKLVGVWLDEDWAARQLVVYNRLLQTFPKMRLYLPQLTTEEMDCIAKLGGESLIDENQKGNLFNSSSNQRIWINGDENDVKQKASVTKDDYQNFNNKDQEMRSHSFEAPVKPSVFGIGASRDFICISCGDDFDCEEDLVIHQNECDESARMIGGLNNGDSGIASLRKDSNIEGNSFEMDVSTQVLNCNENMGTDAQKEDVVDSPENCSRKRKRKNSSEDLNIGDCNSDETGGKCKKIDEVCKNISNDNEGKEGIISKVKGVYENQDNDTKDNSSGDITKKTKTLRNTDDVNEQNDEVSSQDERMDDNQKNSSDFCTNDDNNNAISQFEGNTTKDDQGSSSNLRSENTTCLFHSELTKIDNATNTNDFVGTFKDSRSFNRSERVPPFNDNLVKDDFKRQNANLYSSSMTGLSGPSSSSSSTLKPSNVMRPNHKCRLCGQCFWEQNQLSQHWTLDHGVKMEKESKITESDNLETMKRKGLKYGEVGNDMTKSMNYPAGMSDTLLNAGSLLLQRHLALNNDTANSDKFSKDGCQNDSHTLSSDLAFKINELNNSSKDFKRYQEKVNEMKQMNLSNCNEGDVTRSVDSEDNCVILPKPAQFTPMINPANFSPLGMGTLTPQMAPEFMAGYLDQYNKLAQWYLTQSPTFCSSCLVYHTKLNPCPRSQPDNSDTASNDDDSKTKNGSDVKEKVSMSDSIYNFTDTDEDNCKDGSQNADVSLSGSGLIDQKTDEQHHSNNDNEDEDTEVNVDDEDDNDESMMQDTPIDMSKSTLSLSTSNSRNEDNGSQTSPSSLSSPSITSPAIGFPPSSLFQHPLNPLSTSTPLNFSAYYNYSQFLSRTGNPFMENMAAKIKAMKGNPLNANESMNQMGSSSSSTASSTFNDHPSNDSNQQQQPVLSDRDKIYNSYLPYQASLSTMTQRKSNLSFPSHFMPPNLMNDNSLPNLQGNFIDNKNNNNGNNDIISSISSSLLPPSSYSLPSTSTANMAAFRHLNFLSPVTNSALRGNDDSKSSNNNQNQTNGHGTGGKKRSSAFSSLIANQNPSKQGFPCSVCNRVYSHQTALFTHMRSHSPSARVYRCQFCQKTFPRAPDLKVHVCPNGVEKPFTCPSCGQTFAKNIHLKRHLATHSGLKPYPCWVCGKRFSRSDHLKRHTQSIHAGARPHVCTICGKEFVRKYELNKHMTSHNDIPLPNQITSS